MADSSFHLLFSIADEVRPYAEELCDHLGRIPIGGSPISVWCEPGAGENIERGFLAALDGASVAVVIISQKYLTDETTFEKQLPKIVQKAKAEDSFEVHWFEACPTLIDIVSHSSEEAHYLVSRTPLFPIAKKFHAQSEEQKRACLRDIARKIARACGGENSERVPGVKSADTMTPANPIEIEAGRRISFLFNGEIEHVSWHLPDWENSDERAQALDPVPWQGLDELTFPFLYPRIRDGHVFLEKNLDYARRAERLQEGEGRATTLVDAEEYLRHVEALLSAAIPHVMALLAHLRKHEEVFSERLAPLFCTQRALAVIESCLGSRSRTVLDKAAHFLGRIADWLLEAHRRSFAVAERARQRQ